MDLTNFAKAGPYLTAAVSIHSERTLLAKEHRKLRKLDVDVVRLRTGGIVDPDELIIPQHVIDTNIRREQSRYVSYVTTERRAAVFIDIDDNTKSTELIEKDFSTRVRYDGWELEMFKAIDCMQLHRYAALTVSVDNKLPGNVRVTYVAFEDLLFPADTKELQACEWTGRALYYSRGQLEELRAIEGVSQAVLKELIDSVPNTKNESAEQSLVVLFEFLTRKNGIVYSGLFAQSGASDKRTNLTGWLKTPEKLHLGKWQKSKTGAGLEKVYETSYPFIILPYNISEDSNIFDQQGRADLDQYTQDAVTSLVSSYATGIRRSAGMYWAEDGLAAKSSTTVEMTDIKIVPNRIIKGGLKQFQLAPPDGSVLSSANALLSMNQQETSQINYAALTRKDTEKTAAEVNAAQNEANLLSSSQLSLFSNSLRELYALLFGIIANRVANGLIKDVKPELVQAYARRYVIRPAGDVDVVERQQRLQAMLQAWPVIGKTGAANLFLVDLLQSMFPDRAGAYSQALAEDNQKNQLLAQAAQLIQQLATGPNGQPTPEIAPQAQALQGFLQQIQQALSGQQQ